MGAACLVLSLFATAPAPARADAGYQLVYDDFAGGFNTPDAKWFLPPSGSFATGDGVPTASAGHLTVVPTGVNATTGKPAFAFTTGQESAGGTGAEDQVKWIAVAAHPASSGIPGFDAVPGQVLSCKTSLAVDTYGTDKQPFGLAANPATDPRLASGALVALDMETRTVFDFLLTDKAIFAVYERLRVPGSTYAAFTYMVPVAARTPDQAADLSISFDKSGGTVTWRIGATSVLQVKKIGYRSLDRSLLVLDHGGTEEPVSPRQLTCGYGMFTFLDAGFAGAPGLVRLSSTPGYYFAPRTGEPCPQTFLDEQSLPANRLWGQGLKLTSGPMIVSSEPVS